MQRLALIALAGVWVAAVACGEDARSGPPSGGGSPDGGPLGDGAGSDVTPGDAALDRAAPVPPSGFFDACGGKIVDPKTGAIDPAEYARQARAWDRATIDCRLGPKFTDAYPGQADPRPTLTAPEKKPVPTPASAHLDTYQIGTYQENADAYGVLAAQVLHVPDDDQQAGVDRIYTFDWRSNLISESPERAPGVANAGHPEPAVTSPEWAAALGHPARHPIAAARSPLGQSANAVILFQGGLLGTAPWADRFYKFPETIVPTALALTSSNEFILVTVWDTTDPVKPRGRLAVIMAHWGLPTVGVGYSHRYDNVSNNDVPLTLLGYVDLPFATPTFVAAAGNNGAVVGTDIYYAPSIADLASAGTRTDCSEDTTDRYSACANTVGSSGYAIVLSRWENQAAFIDLAPLYRFVQASLLGDQANYDAATGGPKGATDSPDSGRWPKSFEAAPEQTPVVAYTVAIEHPIYGLAGRGAHNVAPDTGSVQAHIASLDGTVRTYDVRALVNRHAETPKAAVPLASMKAGYNPVAMAWSGDVDPLDPTSTSFGNPRADYSESFMVLSRTDREILWVHASAAGSRVFRRLRDSRLDDPVSLDRNNGFHSAYVISVGDFSSRKVVTYRIGPMHGELVRPTAEIPAPPGPDSIECGGELELSGSVFQVSGANVP